MLQPLGESDIFSFTAEFSQNNNFTKPVTFYQGKEASAKHGGNE